jgi:hypothetical protein
LECYNKRKYIFGGRTSLIYGGGGGTESAFPDATKRPTVTAQDDDESGATCKTSNDFELKRNPRTKKRAVEPNKERKASPSLYSGTPEARLRTTSNYQKSILIKLHGVAFPESSAQSVKLGKISLRNVFTTLI